MRSQSFFDNEPKQILSAIPDLSAKNKQTVAPSIRGTATTTKQLLLLLLRFQIIQSTLPYCVEFHGEIEILHTYVLVF